MEELRFWVTHDEIDDRWFWRITAEDRELYVSRPFEDEMECRREIEAIKAAEVLPPAI